MRIVIIGEFSSFAKNLSAGFRYLGHECFVFSWGDGFKKIEQEGNCYEVHLGQYNPVSGKLGHFHFAIKSFLSYLKLCRFVKGMSRKGKWDVVLILNPCFIKKRRYFYRANFTFGMIYSLINDRQNIFLSSCGGDVPYYDYWSKLKGKNNNKMKEPTKEVITHHNYCSSYINKVIPVAYGYAEAWRNSKYASGYIICPTIPLPLDISEYVPYNEVKEKIIIFHGITRSEDKGTDYIIAAMNKLKKKYPDRVDCFAKGGIPLKDYLELLHDTNIIIDQTYAFSSGMNALYALAMGKVLLGGNEPGNAMEYKYCNIPIINIGPDSEQIYKELEKLILCPEMIRRLSKEGHRYVETVHDCKTVAQQYIDCFVEYGDNLF